MREPRVAVVIPCHNDGRFLTEALASVEEQEPRELVVVDDGSDDPETLAALTALDRTGVRVIRQARRGAAAARTAGLRAASARYVHPLDADDRLAPGALTLLADALDARPEARAAWGDYRTFGATDCYFPQASTLDAWRITYLDEIPGTSLVRRDAALAVGGWEVGAGYEDWDFWMKLAERRWTGVHVPAVTLLYREHASARRYVDNLARHEEHYAQMRSRRSALFSARRRAWWRSPSPWTMKVALPLARLLPGVSEARKRQLYALLRYLFQSEMCSDCYRGPVRRLLDSLGGLRARARVRARG